MDDTIGGAAAGGVEDTPVARVDESLEPLVPRYIQRRREDADAIEHAMSDGQWSTVTKLGHTMKGSGGGYGFDRITEIGAGIEQAGKAHDEAMTREQVKMLRWYLDNVVIEFIEE